MASTATSDYGVITQDLRGKSVEVQTDDMQYRGVVVAIAGMGILLDVTSHRSGADGQFTKCNPRRMLFTWISVNSVEAKS